MRFDHHCGVGADRTPALDVTRGIYYAAFTLSSCLVELFGDATRQIVRQGRLIARPRLLRDLRLLDLRGSGAMRAGTVAAIAKVPDRQITQAWSRFFYERTDLYTAVDGLLFFNAHNDEEALALYCVICNGCVRTSIRVTVDVTAYRSPRASASKNGSTSGR
jgi:hypothetical protein